MKLPGRRRSIQVVPVPAARRRGPRQAELGLSDENGVKVSSKKHRDLKMFFDKETGLLVKTEHTLEDGGKELVQEEYYSEFKETDGYKRPTKLLVFRKGKKLLVKMTRLTDEFKRRTDKLEAALAHESNGSSEKHARHFRDHVVPAMASLRETGDALESTIPHGVWPLATYREMLFIK